MQRSRRIRSTRPTGFAAFGVLSLVGALLIGGTASAAVDATDLADESVKAESSEEQTSDSSGAEGSAETSGSGQAGQGADAEQSVGGEGEDQQPSTDLGTVEEESVEGDTDSEDTETATSSQPLVASRSLSRAAVQVADSGVTKCGIPQGTYSKTNVSTLKRLGGDNRYGTSAAIANHVASTSSTGQSAVFIASGADFADGLALSALATRAGWPILLTAPNNLSSETAAQIKKQKPTHIYIAGGNGAVSASVERQILALAADGATVTRFDGGDRYETSLQIAACFEEGTTAFVTTGDDFPDAVVAAAPAARYDGAVVLTARNKLNASAKEALKSLQSDRVYVIGGTWSSSQTQQIRSAAGTNSVTVYSGSDRYATSAKVASALFANSSVAAFATGTNFPDALAGAAVADLHKAPIVLTKQSCRPKAVESVAKSVKTRILLGGTGTLAASATTTTCVTQVPTYTKVAAAAKAQVGKKYASGAAGPNSFDCSGLTQYAHRQAGISIPRTSWAQWNAGKTVSSPRPGDIVVLNNGGHVGIYMGNGMMVDAGNSRVNVAYRAVYQKANAYVRFT